MQSTALAGKYRNASNLHDVACVERSKHSESVHRMFYDACLAGGVPNEKAKLLYWAVAKFGPKWQSETRVRTTIQSLPNGEGVEVESAYPVSVPIESPEATEEDMQWALSYFAEHDLEVDQIPYFEQPRQIALALADNSHNRIEVRFSQGAFFDRLTDLSA